MNTGSPLSNLRRPALAVILAGSALLMGACSTTSVSREPLEKTVTYKELHGMMVKLAEQPAYGTAQRQTLALAKISTDAGASGTLASNQ